MYGGGAAGQARDGRKTVKAAAGLSHDTAHLTVCHSSCQLMIHTETQVLVIRGASVGCVARGEGIAGCAWRRAACQGNTGRLMRVTHESPDHPCCIHCSCFV